MVAVTSPTFGRRRRSPVAGLGVAVALVVALITLVWAFVDADGLRPVVRTESACEQLWSEGRYTAELADADHDAFVEACQAP